jgi:hypothetical protein
LVAVFGERPLDEFGQAELGVWNDWGFDRRQFLKGYYGCDRRFQRKILILKSM